MALGESLGPALQKARKDLGLDLNQVSQKTKINRDRLLDLECDRLDALSSPAYLRSYLVTLSQLYLKRPEEFLSLIPNNLKDEPFSQSSPEPKARTPKTMGLAIILALFLVFFLIFSLWPKPEMEKKMEVEVDSFPSLEEFETLDTLESISTSDSQLSSIYPKPEGPEETHARTEPVSTLIKKSAGKFSTGFTCISDSVWVNIKRPGMTDLNKFLTRNQSWRVSHIDTLHVQIGIDSSIQVEVQGAIYRPSSKKFSIIGSSLFE